MELLKRYHSKHNTNSVITVCADQVTSCMVSHNETARFLPDLRGGAPTLYLLSEFTTTTDSVLYVVAMQHLVGK